MQIEDFTKRTLAELLVESHNLNTHLEALVKEISGQLTKEQADAFAQYLMKNANAYAFVMGTHYFNLLQNISIQLNGMKLETDQDRAKIQQLACSIDKAIACFKNVNSKRNKQ